LGDNGDDSLEGEILLAEFTTRDSAIEWFAIAKTLVRS
jgi:hypothetical protein